MYMGLVSLLIVVFGIFHTVKFGLESVLVSVVLKHICILIICHHTDSVVHLALISLPVSPAEYKDAAFIQLLSHRNPHPQNHFGFLHKQQHQQHQQRQHCIQHPLHLQGGFQTYFTPCRVHLRLPARPPSQRCCHTEDMENSAQSVQKQHLHAQPGHS